MQVTELTIEGKTVAVSHPGKMLWPESGITKLDYIRYLLDIAPHLLAYTRDRMLMAWVYPGGIHGPRLEQRSIHGQAPAWVPRIVYKEKERILLNDAATLVWVANLGACELHVPFDRFDRKDYPTELAFDLDPAEGQSYAEVLEVALRLKETLDGLGLHSFPKTSGATGLQIFVPIEPKYTFDETRVINRFVAEYLQQKMPAAITLDRVVERRGRKLYFDYLQLWRGRTMAAPYSVRARPLATVSTPVTWEEAGKGFKPGDFTVRNVPDRMRRFGDLFHPVSAPASQRLNQDLETVLAFIRNHS